MLLGSTLSWLWLQAGRCFEWRICWNWRIESMGERQKRASVL
jgi:hypothetical protein